MKWNMGMFSPTHSMSTLAVLIKHLEWGLIVPTCVCRLFLSVCYPLLCNSFFYKKQRKEVKNKESWGNEIFLDSVNVPLKDLRKMRFAFWDLDKWFKSISWTMWDWIVRFGFRFARHWFLCHICLGFCVWKVISVISFLELFTVSQKCFILFPEQVGQWLNFTFFCMQNAEEMWHIWLCKLSTTYEICQRAVWNYSRWSFLGRIAVLHT